MRPPAIPAVASFAVGLLLGVGLTGAATGLRGSDRFSDIPDGSYFNEAAGEMAEIGVFRGRPDGRFDPSAYATRAEIAVMLKRLRDNILGTESERVSAVRAKQSGSRALAPASSEQSEEQAAPAAFRRNPGGSFRFSIDEFDTAEYAGTATVNVLRTGGKTGTVSVTFALEGGTATAGEDYESMTKTLTFADGETNRVFLVRVVDDDSGEGNETVQMTLSNPTGGSELGMPSTATLTIEDDDGGSAEGAGAGGTANAGSAAGTIAFGALAYSMGEDRGEIAITVERRSGSDGAVTVWYAMADGTAKAQSDYTPAKGTLNFAEGETEKIFSVQITDDNLTEGKETVKLTLSDPTGGAKLGAQSSAILEIIDDEVLPFGAGKFRFGDTEYDADEEAGSFTVMVNRIGGAEGEVTVAYATSDGNAKAGQDYTAVNAVLTFRSGETKQVISVPILTDDKDDPDEIFTILLSNPTGGAELGAPERATVTIVQ